MNQDFLAKETAENNMDYDTMPILKLELKT